MSGFVSVANMSGFPCWNIVKLKRYYAAGSVNSPRGSAIIDTFLRLDQLIFENECITIISWLGSRRSHAGSFRKNTATGTVLSREGTLRGALRFLLALPS